MDPSSLARRVFLACGPAGDSGSGAAETAATLEMAGPGTGATSEPGHFAIFPAGNLSDSQAGDEGVTLLIVELVPGAAAGTPDTRPAPTDWVVGPAESSAGTHLTLGREAATGAVPCLEAATAASTSKTATAAPE